MLQSATEMAWSRVSAYGLRALGADETAMTAGDRVTLATALGILGRYDEALTLLDACASAEPDVALAVVKLCQDAGAAEITLLINPAGKPPQSARRPALRDNNGIATL